MNPMLQNALPAVLLLAIMVGIALALKWARGRLPGMPAGGAVAKGPALQLLSSLSVGPQQRVITVQVDDGQTRTCLVLGVAAGSITTLHSLPAMKAWTEVVERSASVVLRTNSSHSAMEAVKASWGLSVFPSYSRKGENLIEAPIDLNITRDIWLVSHEETNKGARIRAVIDYIRDVAEYVTTNEGVQITAGKMLERFLFGVTLIEISLQVFQVKVIAKRQNNDQQ